LVEMKLCFYENRKFVFKILKWELTG